MPVFCVVLLHSLFMREKATTTTTIQFQRNKGLSYNFCDIMHMSIFAYFSSSVPAEDKDEDERDVSNDETMLENVESIVIVFLCSLCAERKMRIAASSFDPFFFIRRDV